MKEFDEFDNIEVPDRWDDIVARAETTNSSGPDGGVRRRSGVLVLLGAAAMVVAMLAGFVVLNRMSEDVIVSPVTEPSVSEPSASDPSPTQSPSTAVPTTEPLAPLSQECASRTDLGAIGDLFRAGQPTYDYTAARDVAELVEQSDVVVAGTVAGVQRQQGGRETYTVFDVDDVEVLAGTGQVESFVTNSVWPFLDEPDPLSDRIGLEGVRFVAFLESLDLNSAPSRWQPNVEGFAFGCGDLPAESLGGLPPDARGLTVDGIVEVVESSVEPLSDEFGDEAWFSSDSPLLTYLEIDTGPEGFQRLEVVHHDLIARCMSDAGFEYIAPLSVEAQNRAFQLNERLSVEERRAFDEALNAFGTADLDDGCFNTTQKSVFPGRALSDEIVDAGDFIVECVERPSPPAGCERYSDLAFETLEVGSDEFIRVAQLLVIDRNPGSVERLRVRLTETSS